jgi:uncharacterized protein YfaS (alpha-2-macroglobulin family)
LCRTAQRLAAMHWRIALPENAMQGGWRAALHMDPKRPPIAEVSFLVEDFPARPDRIELDAGTGVVSARPVPAEIAVTGRYLYGAPAGGLQTEGEIFSAAPDA